MKKAIIAIAIVVAVFAVSLAGTQAHGGPGKRGSVAEEEEAGPGARHGKGGPRAKHDGKGTKRSKGGKGGEGGKGVR